MRTPLPDLSLPPTTPLSITKYRYLPPPRFIPPIALYTLIPISPNEALSAQQICESESQPESEGSNVLLAPIYSFPSQPLKAIFEYHTKLIEEEERKWGEEGVRWNPSYFLVVVEREWRGRGVGLVALDDGEGGTGVVRVRAEDSGVVVGGLGKGSVEWGGARGGWDLGGYGVGSGRR